MRTGGVDGGEAPVPYKKSMDEVHTYRGRLRITEALVPEGTVPIDTIIRRGADFRNFQFSIFN